MKPDVLELAYHKLKAERDAADVALSSLQENKSAEQNRDEFAARVSKESDWRKAIDQACAEFAAGRSWPLTDDFVVKKLFWDRVECAYGFACWLRESGFCGPDVPLEAMLKLLLVDYWNAAGACGWKSTLLDLQEICKK